MRVINWILALCGLWEFGDIAAIFVPGFGNIPAFVWNHIAIGLIWMVAGVWAARTGSRGTASTLSWVAAIAGAWLVMASFVLRNPAVSPGLLNDVIVGVVVFFLGAWAGLAARRTAG